MRMNWRFASNEASRVRAISRLAAKQRVVQATSGDYLRGRAARRFAGTTLRCLVTGVVVSAASNNCRNPCSNSSTAFPKAELPNPDYRDGPVHVKRWGPQYFHGIDRMIPGNKARRQQPDTITGLNER